MKKEAGYLWKLGMFVTCGLAIFVLAIYYVGKQKNLFGSTFHIKSQFKNVNGLKEGNNVRLSGINIGTVEGIELTSDTSVMVTLVVKNSIKKFINSDAITSIGSDGLMGDKVLVISSGTGSGTPIKDNGQLTSSNSVEIADIMKSLKTSVDNAGVITGELAQFSYKMNNGNGALSRLISDETFSNSLKSTLFNLQNSTDQFSKFTTKMNDGKLDSTMANLQSGTKGLSDNMDAVKHSFLLRRYFRNKKKKADTLKTVQPPKKVIKSN